MLSGTADIDALSVGAPTVETWATEALTSEHVRVLHVAHEVDNVARASVLPPGLHPCTPAAFTATFIAAADSDVGPFTLCLLRMVCRSGVRSRGYLVDGFVSTERAASALAGGWGLRVRHGDVVLESSYAATWGSVIVDGRCTIDVGLVGPQPIAADAVQYTATMSLAHTPTGLRLAQVEPALDIDRAERGRLVLRDFDADAWGQPALRPSSPIAASSATARLRIPPVRFVCRPDVPAFGATERVGEENKHGD